MTYKNINGRSNVLSYTYGNTYIKVTFRGGSTYTYTYESAGKDSIEIMKKYADQGYGLNSFIMRYAKNNYAYKN